MAGLNWLNPTPARSRTTSWSRWRTIRHEDSAYGHSGSVPYADLHAVRGSGLVLLRDQCCHAVDLRDSGRLCFHPARTNSSFAWNHGDIQDEIATTWVGYVGQGVEDSGIDRRTWSDHTDVRPTILALVGLRTTTSMTGVLSRRSWKAVLVQPQ